MLKRLKRIINFIWFGNPEGIRAMTHEEKRERIMKRIQDTKNTVKDPTIH